MIMPVGEIDNLKNNLTIKENMLHHGVKPIIGPVKDEDIELVIKELKQKNNTAKDIRFLVLDGVVM